MDIDLVAVAILLGCGLAMGAINNLAGAAGALGLIGLQDAAGLADVEANASLRLGAVGIGLAGWIGFKSRGIAIPRRAWTYGLIAVPGAFLGTQMALELPIWVYRSTLLAVLCIALLQQLRGRRSAHATKTTRPAIAAALFFLVGLHMGFIQIATGLVALIALSAVHSRDLVEVNAAKMALVICSSIVAVASFAVAGQIAWVPSLSLAIGCGLGSFFASRWSVDKGHGAVRAVVLLITTAVLARLIWQMLA